MIRMFNRETTTDWESESVVVELTHQEMILAGMVGVQRQAENAVVSRFNKANAPPQMAWRNHVCGALGEMAVAKWLGDYWSGAVGDLSVADVGKHQVRWAGRQPPELVVRPGDSPEDNYILVTGPGPPVQLVGWIEGELAFQKNAEPRGGRPPAHFVPWNETRLMRDLP